MSWCWLSEKLRLFFLIMLLRWIFDVFVLWLVGFVLGEIRLVWWRVDYSFRLVCFLKGLRLFWIVFWKSVGFCGMIVKCDWRLCRLIVEILILLMVIDLLEILMSWNRVFIMEFFLVFVCFMMLICLLFLMCMLKLDSISGSFFW